MNEAAELFDDWARRGRDAGMESGHFPRAEAILEALEVAPGHRALDLGCGNGWAARWMADRSAPGGSVQGVDLAPTMLERARDAATDRPDVDFLRASFDELPFEDGRFDRVFSMEAVYYADDLDRVLDEIRRVLRPDGRLGLGMDFYRENPFCHSWPEDLSLSMHLLGEAEWEARLAARGFHVERRFRSLDPRPLPDDASEETVRFRRDVGSLALIARPLP